jgi:hypothetical protein
VGGFLRFLVLFVLLGGFLVFIALPLAAGLVLTQTVRDMGLRSDSLQVTLALFDPSLMFGRSRSMHISAGNVELTPGGVGTLELTLGDVSLFDRTWGSIDGEISGLSLTTGGQTFTVGSVHVGGDAESAIATARMSASEAEALILFAAEREGVPLQSVHVGDDGVRVRAHGAEANARLEVRGGALVLLPGTGDGGVPLIQPAPSDAWRLEEAWISDDGLNVRGTVDTTRLAEDVTT